MVIASTLMVSLIAGCSEVKAYRGTGETISTKVNQEFIIATSSNPPSGYMWREDYDENMFELVASTLEVSEAVKRGEARVILEQHFQFKALKKGKTEIYINLAGPNPKYIKEQKVFNVNIE